MDGSVGGMERREGGQDRILTNKMVTILSGHGGDVMTADTVDLGPGGMFVATEKPFDVGDRFICRIELGEPYKPVLSGAEVRWVDSSRHHQGMGVRFVDIAEAASSLGGELPSAGPETVKVRLDSVGPALDALVVERSGEKLIIDAVLPFFKNGSRVDVGPDISARTAAIRAVEWIPNSKGENVTLRLSLDLERTAAETAASQVVRKSEALTVTDLPLKEIKPSQETETEPESMDSAAEEKPKPNEAKATRKVKRKAKKKLESNWSRRAKMLNWTRDDDSTQSEANAVQVIDDRNEIDEIDEVDEVDEIDEKTAFEQVKAQVVDGAAEKAASEQVKAQVVDRVAEKAASEQVEIKTEKPQNLARETAEAQEREELNDDPIDMATFNPVHGALKRVLGTVLFTRLLGLWAKGKPRLAEFVSWSLDKTKDGWSWIKDNAGPAIGRLGKALRSSRLLNRKRRQSRREPSNVVRNLTDRARKVAAGRGKTVALVLFVSLSVVGLATAGYGLIGSNSAETEREQLQSEAIQSGWSSDRWQEPEPAETPNS